MSIFWKNCCRFVVHGIYDGGVSAIAWLTWIAFGSILSAWVIFLKPGLMIPLIHFRTHPDYVAYLLFPAFWTLVVLLMLTLGLRRFAARFCPELDNMPTPAKAIARLVTPPLLPRLLVGAVTLCLQWTRPDQIERP